VVAPAVDSGNTLNADNCKFELPLDSTGSDARMRWARKKIGLTARRDGGSLRTGSICSHICSRFADMGNQKSSHRPARATTPTSPDPSLRFASGQCAALGMTTMVGPAQRCVTAGGVQMSFQICSYPRSKVFPLSTAAITIATSPDPSLRFASGQCASLGMTTIVRRTLRSPIDTLS
jgi:hypothetical protein